MRRDCPVCGSKQIFLIRAIPLKLPDQYDFLPSGFALVKCNRCDLIFNDTKVTETELHNYYHHPSYLATRPYRNETQRLEDVADRMISPFLKYAFYPSPIKFFEIGYEDGELRKHLKTRGFTCDIGAIPSPKSHYDLIIINQVLEHVLNPKEFLDSLRPHAPLFYIDVPDGTKDEVYHFEHLQHFEMGHLHRLCDHPLDTGQYRWEAMPKWFTHTIWGFWPTYHRVYVRGFGMKAFQRIAQLKLKFNTEIVGIIDQNPRGLTFQGKPVMSPDEALEPGVPVLICVDSPHLLDEIKEEYLDRLCIV